MPVSIAMRLLTHAGVWAGGYGSLEWFPRLWPVETKMNCFKRLVEKATRGTFERQVSELHIRAAILNQSTELGRLRLWRWPSCVWGRSISALSMQLCLVSAMTATGR